MLRRIPQKKSRGVRPARLIACATFEPDRQDAVFIRQIAVSRLKRADALRLRASCYPAVKRGLLSVCIDGTEPFCAFRLEIM